MPGNWQQLLIWLIAAVIIVFTIVKLWPVVIGGPLM